jgi:hypothetical protein
VLAATNAGRSATCLAPATINRIFATISSFYEYLILLGACRSENPMQVTPDPALARVSADMGLSWVRPAANGRFGGRSK